MAARQPTINRPVQHQAGDLGELRAAQLLLQHGWIINKLYSDYGFDFLIQRTEGELVTADFALVQVKSIQSIDMSDSNKLHSVKIATRHMLLWNSAPLPAFLVVVNLANEDVFLFNCKVLAQRLEKDQDSGRQKESYEIRAGAADTLDSHAAAGLASCVADYCKSFRVMLLQGDSGAAAAARWIPGLGAALSMGVAARVLYKVDHLNSQLSSVVGIDLADKVVMETIRSIFSHRDKKGVKSIAPNPGPQPDGTAGAAPRG